MTIELNNWKLTIDIEDPNKKDRPLEIVPPELLTFQHPHFINKPECITFKAECGGKTTKNSKYPRSELRELDQGKLAAWSINRGTHIMTWTCSVTNLPIKKPQVVVGQIHDGEDDVVEIRHTKDYVEVIHDSNNYGKLITGYKLGDIYTVIMTASKGQITIFSGKTTIAVKTKSKEKDCYFKLGCYTQSNVSKGDAEDAYGEVKVYKIKVEHKK